MHAVWGATNVPGSGWELALPVHFSDDASGPAGFSTLRFYRVGQGHIERWILDGPEGAVSVDINGILLLRAGIEPNPGPQKLRADRRQRVPLENRVRGFLAEHSVCATPRQRSLAVDALVGMAPEVMDAWLTTKFLSGNGEEDVVPTEAPTAAVAVVQSVPVCEAAGTPVATGNCAGWDGKSVLKLPRPAVTTPPVFHIGKGEAARAVALQTIGSSVHDVAARLEAKRFRKSVPQLDLPTEGPAAEHAFCGVKASPRCHLLPAHPVSQNTRVTGVSVNRQFKVTSAARRQGPIPESTDKLVSVRTGRVITNTVGGQNLHSVVPLRGTGRFEVKQLWPHRLFPLGYVRVSTFTQKPVSPPIHDVRPASLRSAKLFTVPAGVGDVNTFLVNVGSEKEPDMARFRNKPYNDVVAKLSVPFVCHHYIISLLVLAAAVSCALFSIVSSVAVFGAAFFAAVELLFLFYDTSSYVRYCPELLVEGLLRHVGSTIQVYRDSAQGDFARVGSYNIAATDFHEYVLGCYKIGHLFLEEPTHYESGLNESWRHGRALRECASVLLAQELGRISVQVAGSIFKVAGWVRTRFQICQVATCMFGSSVAQIITPAMYRARRCFGRCQHFVYYIALRGVVTGMMLIQSRPAHLRALAGRCLWRTALYCAVFSVMLLTFVSITSNLSPNGRPLRPMLMG